MVYFPNSIITLLQTHIEGLPLDCNIIFPNTKYQGYINLENFRRRVWKPLLIASGIDERCRIHDIRGVYVDISLNNGATIKFVQNQLGHAKSQTTLDVYAQNSKDMIKKGLDAIDVALNYKNL